MDTVWYWIFGVVASITALAASWSIVSKIRYNKVTAKNNSIAAGNDVNINSKNNLD